MACTSKYLYSNCQTPNASGSCRLYTTDKLTTTVGAGYHKFSVGGFVKQFTTNSSGVIIAESTCSWTSTYTYAPLYTGTKNDCVAGSCSVIGSTVNLNDGNPANAYSGYATATSYISQADADYNAQQQAVAMFDAGKQAAVNSRGYCTWTYSSGSATYPATNYTRNNCGSNCYGTTVTYGAVTKSGYSYTSTISCTDAVNNANQQAYNAAQSESQSAGQAYANSNGGCCCWEYETYCSGCSLRSRERNNCTGETRNDALVSGSTCSCGASCGGTYWSYYCSDTTRMRELRYNCDGSYAGTNEVFQTCSSDCGASTAPLYTPQNYTTCISCYNAPVYKDTNGCSGTGGQYYYENQAGNKVLIGFSQPSGTPCNTNSNCVDTGSAYCSGPNWVINQTQASYSCSTDPCPVRVIEYNSQTNGCYTPPPACYNYNIIRITTSGNVTGNYTTCNGAASTFNLTRPDGSTGSVGTICARQGSVSITSGNGQVQTGSSCNNT